MSPVVDAPTTLPAALRQARLDMGISQMTLALRAGVSLQSVLAWEQGRKRPRLRHLLAVADALGISRAAILELQ